jgi:hypothetical protein
MIDDDDDGDGGDDDNDEVFVTLVLCFSPRVSVQTTVGSQTERKK